MTIDRRGTTRFSTACAPRPIRPPTPSCPGSSPGRKTRSAAFRALVVHQHEVADPALTAFLDGRADRPRGCDPTLVAAGQECFARWGSHVFTALYAAALALGLCLLAGGPGARPDGTTRDRRQASAQRDGPVPPRRHGARRAGPGRPGLLRRPARPADACRGALADPARPARDVGPGLGDAHQSGGSARDAPDVHRDRVRGVRPHRHRLHRSRTPTRTCTRGR